MNKPELILGTAEFNREAGYGGKPPLEEGDILQILNVAWFFGIRTLDTADTYKAPTHLYGGFKQLFKSRVDKDAFYHYQPKEGRIEGITRASVYDLEQVEGLKEVIVPLNPHNTAFVPLLNGSFTRKIYARSIFDRGKLLETEGGDYAIEDCLHFAMRHPVNGIIVGVNSVLELEDIMEAYNAI